MIYKLELKAVFYFLRNFVPCPIKRTFELNNVQIVLPHSLIHFIHKDYTMLISNIKLVSLVEFHEKVLN